MITEEMEMTIYKSKRDNKLYLLSISNGGGRYTGSWLECIPYYEYLSDRYNTWKKVPDYKRNDFVAVGERG
jgi:hypothetical protein